MQRVASLTRPFTRALGALAIIALSGCLSIEGTPEGLAVLTVVAGNNQSLTAGSGKASDPLTVRTLDQAAAPMPNIPVTWAISSGGGTLSTASTVTDGAGNSSITYTPSATAGQVFVRATAQELNVTFTIIVSAPAGG